MEDSNNGKTSSILIFFVNGRKIEDKHVDPECTLLYYLRSKLRLCGTKLGCGEGGCGACTVMVSKFDRSKGRPIHLAVNSCLTPVAAMHGQAVTTVEGIGNIKTKLHPIQERIAKAHGSQCGFCTPGFVMSMYALLRNSQGQPSMTDIDIAFQGNLCRCTGYRPIREGFKTFTAEGCPMKDQCCRVQNKNTSNGFITEAFDSQLFDAKLLAPYDPSQELIFPPELMVSNIYDEQFLKICGPRVTWLRPTSLKQLLDLKAQIPGSKLIGGNSEIGVEVKFKNCLYPTLISPSQLHELAVVKTSQQLNGRFPRGTFLKIGGTTSLTDLEESLKMLIKTEPAHSTRIFSEMLDILYLFSGKQIRNMGTVGGNIMTGSPISDLNPIFMASNSIVELISAGSPSRYVQMDSKFWTGYRRNIIEPNEIIAAIYVPYTTNNQYFKAYKQSKRREDDIAIVNGAFFFDLGNEGTILQARMAYGGLGPVTKLAAKTAQCIQGLNWSAGLIEKASTVLLEEVKLDPGAPGGMVEYRMTLALSLLFKAFLSVSNDLGSSGLEIDLPASHCKGQNKFYPSEFNSSQYFSVKPDSESEVNPIGRPTVHQSALKQATGEAVYCDDITPLENELYLALVTSAKAHAKLISVDPSDALKLPGVVKFLSAKDISPEKNKFGLITKDEELFASKKVKTQGQVIGLIIAEQRDLAQRAAKLVKIEYDELEPIITIEQAIIANSYFPPSPQIMKCGDIDFAFAKSDHIIEGEMKVGGQEHFYLETQVSIAVPTREDDEIIVYSSSQSPTYIQGEVSFALGIPKNKVVVKVKRLGGGFGGKETRSALLAVYTALAAQKLGRAVRLSLDRHEDMAITGQRHPFLGKYKASFMADGRITGLHIRLYSNGGWSLDMSNLVMEKAMLHVTNCCFVPNVLCEGYSCKTNIPSNTAFRGFGSPQSMIISETIMSRISHVTGVHPNKVHELNFYKNGDLTPYYQQMTDVTIQKCWNEVIKAACFDHLADNVKQFNKENKFRKRGISVVPTMFGVGFSEAFLNQAGALLLVYTDGTVLISHGGTEMGQGLHTKMLQVASRGLGIPSDKIHISETSTDKVPNTSSTAASMSSDLYGMAILDACKTIKERLKPVIEHSPNGTWEEWVLSAYFQRISLTATGFYKVPNISFDSETKKGVASSYFTTGAACSVVEVDCLTGDHQVMRTDIVMDVGESLNPAIDIGQIEGAFTQGYGLYTMEELVVSPSGTLLSRGPGTYKIPGFTDIPTEFNVYLLRGVTNPRAVYSSKAIGEPPLFSSASIFFGIRDAIYAYRLENGSTGWFSLDSPATAERIRMACEDAFCKITKNMTSVQKGTSMPWNIPL